MALHRSSIMKSRVMGDYQARFCERFEGEIPSYLLDLFRQPFSFKLVFSLFVYMLNNFVHVDLLKTLLQV